MAVNKRLLQGAAAAPGGITPSEHFGVVLYEGDGSSSHSINGGKFGAGGYFNGEQNSGASYIEISSDTTSPVSSVSFWVNSKTKDSNEGNLFAAGGGSSSNTGFTISRAPTTGYIRLAFTNGSTGNRQIFNGTTDVCDGSWHHIALSMADDNTFVLYLDDSSHITGTRTRFTTANSHNLSVNRLGTNAAAIGASSYEGKIDQVRIFQKALSSSEVSTLYAETAATVESLDPLSEDTTDTLQVLGDSSCIATYRFENNEDDESGNYDGTGTAIQYTAGRYGQAASFNGTASTITNSIDLDNYGETWSISYWIKFTFNSSYRGIMGDVNSSAYNGFVSDQGTSGEIRFRLRSSSASVSSLTSTGTYGDGNWHHVVCVKGSSTNYLYIDGALDSSIATTTGINHTGTFTLGTIGDYTADRFKGELDQVRIFNKELSASEVTTLYNENSLVASYRFEGNANDDTRNYDGTASNVTYEYGLNFTPDLVWAKHRNHGTAHSHNWADSTRGGTKIIYSNTTDAQETISGSIQSFDTGGFTVGNSAAVNADGIDYVAWCFKANGGTTSSNTDGTITSTVQANTDAGFSIVKFTGTGTNNTLVGHGLSQSPEIVIGKKLTGTSINWQVLYSGFSEGDYLTLNTTAAKGTSANVSFDPTSTTFKLQGGQAFNYSSEEHIAYCFHSVEGFSKFGTYTGNGSTDGPIIETGFEPAFIMFKRTDSTGDWRILDNKRSQTNPRNEVLKPNSSEAEESDSPSLKVDFLSNGFQLKSTHSSGNTSGATYIYMAFAADPDTEAPTVAKSFTTKTYTGTGSAQSIDGFGFKPNLLYIKRRTGASGPNMTNSVTGIDFYMFTDSTSNFGTDVNHLGSFDDDGFTTAGGGNAVNGSGEDYVAWAWKADDNEPTLFGGPAKAVYKFEDNANDVTGNYNGTASNVSYVTGKFNKAADFNGTNSKITFSTGFSQQTSFTVSFWLKTSQYNDDHTIFQFEGDSNENSNRIGLFASGTEFGFYPHNTSGGAGRTSISTSDSSALYDGNWHHVVLVVDGTSNTSAKIYIDGVSKTLTTYESYTTTMRMTGNMRIGGRKDDASGEFMDGEIDQLRIYSGAVSDIGVAALYAETASDNDDLLLGAPKETIISANANAGFSIVKYEGNGVAGTKVSHGLSAAPEMIIVKNLSSSTAWAVFHTSIGATKYLSINETTAVQTATNVWNDTAPNSTTFTVGTWSPVNNNGDEHIAYCFHSVSGYSKFGSYTGTGQPNNAITLGFQPDWIMIKNIDQAQDWNIFDSVRDGSPLGDVLKANTSAAEATEAAFVITITSTGFELDGSAGAGGEGQINKNGFDYIYAAFKIN